MAVGTGVEVSITELVQIIQQLNAELSDAQALAEAHNILNMADQGVMSTALAVRGTSEISVINTGSAQQALADYIAAGGTITTGGAASASTISVGNVTALEAGGKISAGGILSLSLPTVAAAIAPVLGVAVGVGLYESNPELWTKISQTLLPFCWKDTDVIPAVVDKDGQVYLDEKIFDSMKQLIEDEGIGKEGYSASNPTLPNGKKLNGPIIKTSTAIGKVTAQNGKYSLYPGAQFNGRWTDKNNNNRPVGAVLSFLENVYGVYDIFYMMTEYGKINLYTVSKESPGTQLSNIYMYTDNYRQSGGESSSRFYSITYGGKTAYYNIHTAEGDLSTHLAPAIQKDVGRKEDVAWYVAYGEFIKEGIFPEGTSKWGGQVPSDYTQNSINVIKNAKGESTTYCPVTLPTVAKPGVSNNPGVLPNPQAPTPLPELEKYIPTIVQPSQYPSTILRPEEETRTAPLPAPLLPSLIIDTATNPSLKYDPPKAPPITGVEDAIPPTISIGDSPLPIFPVPGKFPSIVPTSGSGLIHVYNPTPEEMIAFGHWLWTTYADTSIQKLWNNPFDGVISAHELYATPSTDGKDNIRSGFLVCPTQAALVRQRYTEINCGSLVVPEWYNNYLDYAPYSKAHVYLPFIGIVELDVDDIVGHGVNILYHVDAYNGSCIAQITVAKSDYTNTVYQFSGNCAVDMPLAGGSQAAIRAGLIGAAATGISSVVGGLASLLTGNVGGAISGVSYGLGNAVTQAVSQKSSVQHSGTFGASYGAMGIKKPYIIIRRPIQKQVLNYNAEYGFPAHKRVVIGQCQGYLRVREVHVQSPTATVEERRRIDELLREGIIINTIESSEEIE